MSEYRDLSVEAVGMSWDEAIEMVTGSSYFIDWPHTDFLDDAGRHPDLRIVLNRFEREGLLRGLIVKGEIDHEAQVLSVKYDSWMPPPAKTRQEKIADWERARSRINQIVEFWEAMVYNGATEDEAYMEIGAYYQIASGRLRRMVVSTRARAWDSYDGRCESRDGAGDYFNAQAQRIKAIVESKAWNGGWGHE